MGFLIRTLVTILKESSQFTNNPMIGMKNELRRFLPGLSNLGNAVMMVFAVLRYDYRIGSARVQEILI